MRRQWLSENVSQLMMRTYRKKLDKTFSKFVSDKMTVNFNVFSTFVEDGIGDNVDGSLIITKNQCGLGNWDAKI